jgi:hypothetical protein
MARALSRRLWVFKAAILAAALAILLLRLHAPIDGEHYFRQTHVAANIDKYVADGISLRPSTYNSDAPLALYDFPASEIAVAALCRLFGIPPLQTARLFNLALFGLSFVILDRLMVKTRVRPLAGLLTLFFFAFAPLNLYYLATPLPDPLAVCASLASLLAFVSWEAAPDSQPLAYVALCALGVLATLVKNPVYLPVAVAIPVYLALRRGARSVVRPGVLALGSLIVVSVVLFKIYSNTVNHLSAFLTSEEAGQYFGEFSQRLDPWTWGSVFGNLAKTINPLALGLSLLGVSYYTLRSRSPYRGLYLGLFFGSIVTLLVFFSRFTWHDYYHLPFVFPLAFFAGDLADRLRRIVDRRRLFVRHPRWAGVGVLLLLGGASLALSGRGLASFFSGRKPGQTTRALVAAGDWIQGRTGPRDFVVYVVDDHENWNPAYLYFAKRDGFNIHLHSLSHRSLAGIRAAFFAGHARLFVFCPEPFLRTCAGRLKVSSPGFAPSEDPGSLYELPAPPRDASASSADETGARPANGK